MTAGRRVLRSITILVRLSAATVAVKRLAGAAFAAPPIRPTMTPRRSISVVVPARDEAGRIGPLLESIVGAPGVEEVIVLDDQSNDRTAEIACAAGATVVPGAKLPTGWVGKAWALQQGVEGASGDWIVTLDADTRPHPALPTAVVSRALGDRVDLLTVAGRFECPTPGARWLHPALLTTLVYRFGPPGVAGSADRMMANGQCMAFNRVTFLAAGGMGPVRGEVVEDIALARAWASDGATVGFLDASELLTVEMFDSIGNTWTGWGRSIALPGVDTLRRQLLELSLIVLAQASPLLRVFARRADALDLALVAVRFGTLYGTRSAYTKTGGAYWLSPLADLPAVLAIALGIQRRTQVWRGRSYS